MKSFIPTNNQGENFANLQKEFFSYLYKRGGHSWEIYLELDEFFSKLKDVQLQKYKDTYFVFYVAATWKFLNKLPFEKVEYAFKKQVSAAMVLDIDVLEKLMGYLMTHSFVETDVPEMYQRLKDNFFTSDFLLSNNLNGKKVYLRDIVQQVSLINDRGNDALKLAELRVYLKKLLFPDNKLNKYFQGIDSEEITGRFIDLIHFFLGVKKDKILYVLDVYENPDRYEDWEKITPGSLPKKLDDNTKSVSKTQQTKTLNSKTQKQIPKEEIIELDFNDVSAKNSAELSLKKETKISNESKTAETVENSPPTMKEIKMVIDNKFPEASHGGVADVEKVLVYLDDFATQYNNDLIRDLFYFDETQGMFVWNQDLLK